MSNLRTVFTHSKPSAKKNKSRVTVAGIINYDTKEVSVHASRNNPNYKDVFNKKEGRERALGRAKKRPLETRTFNEPKEGIQVFLEMANEIMNHPNKLAVAQMKRKLEVEARINQVEISL